MEPIPDTIEREILIRAHALRPDPERDHVTIVTDPEYGDFSIETLESRAPERIVFRWLGGAVDEGKTVVTTRVEFTLRATADGTVLRVVESGWAAVDPSEEVAGEYRENSEGWESELAAAKTFLEQ